MANPPRDRVSVTESGEYRNASDGPRQDTNAYTRDNHSHQPDRPGHIDGLGPDRPTGSHGVLPNLRSSVRTFEETDRRRPRELPSWAPYLISAVVFVVIMAIGVFAVMQATARPETVEQVKPKAEEIGGVPVRDDLNAPGL